MTDESLIDDEFSRLLDEFDLAYKRNELDDFWRRNSVASDLKERIERAHEGLRTLETFLVKRTHDETPVVLESNLFGALLNKPVQLDRFQVIREIGRGGFGIVYLANDPKLNRQVAIKIPRIETLGTNTLQNRFAKEAEIAASLDHLYIVPVFEVGTTSDGIFIVSLYCPGTNLAQWLQEHPHELNCNQIVELMVSMSDAMAYCHERGVLHRDIKPANVLLFPSSFGLLPFLPRLNDFGLAKVLESTISETASSVMLGTPLYMAPEQACSKFDEVCPATDVYALGVMFFELLTGQPPFRGTGLAETLDKIRTELPVIPRAMKAHLPRDLETICLKCLAKQPKDRYATAKELLGDLHAFRAGETISARRLNSFERFGRWAAKKSRIAVLLWLGVVGVLLVALPFVTAPRTAPQFAQVKTNAKDRSAKNGQYVHDLRKAMSLNFVGNRDVAKQVLETYKDGPDAEAMRDFAWHFLEGRSNLRKQVFEGLTGMALCADISPDMKWIVGGDRSGNVCIWNAETTELVKNFNYSQREVCAIEFSPDGMTLATAGQDSKIHIWDCSTWEHMHTFAELAGTNTGLAWRPNSKFLASCNRHNEISIWNTVERKRQKILKGVNDVVRDVAWSRNGNMIAANVGGSVVIWSPKDWSVKKKYPISDDTLHSLAFSGDSKQLVSVGHSQKLNLIDCEQLGEVREIDSNGHLYSVGWSPDGRYLAAGLTAGGPRIWSTESMNELTTLENSDNTVRTAKFTEDNKKLLSVHEETSQIILWDLVSSLGYEQLTPSGFPLCIQSKEIDTIYATSDLTTRVIDARSEKLLLEVGQPTPCATISQNGERFARESDRYIEIWDIVSKTKLVSCNKPNHPITNVQYSPDGKRLIVITSEFDWTLYELEQGTMVASGASNSSYLRPSVSFSLDGRTFVVVRRNDLSPSFSFQVRSVDDGRILAEFQWESPNDAIANADSTELYVATSDGVSVIEIVNKTVDSNRFRTRRGIARLALSPDGRTLAAWVKDEGIYLWNVRTGEELFPIMQTRAYIDQLRFTANSILQFRKNDHGAVSFVVFR